MPSTHTALYYHLVFSTKNREPWLGADIRQRVHTYLGGIVRGQDGVALAVGDQEAHHRETTFQEEYVEMLRRGMVEFDDRYLW